MPKATAAAIVLSPDTRQVLLTRRNIPPFQGQWCLPGGHIDPYESARAAVIREVKEETGLDYTPEFFCYEDEIIPQLNIHAVVIVFTGQATGQLQAQATEVSDIAWFKLSEARDLALAFSHNAILDRYVLH